MKYLPHIYIAGPYTRPDPVSNTRLAIEVGMGLYKAGVGFPVIPHLSLLTHMVVPNDDVNFWYDFDLHLLARCDALLRIPGYSLGADEEERFARDDLGIPVYSADSYLDLDAMVKWSEDWKCGR